MILSNFLSSLLSPTQFSGNFITLLFQPFYWIFNFKNPTLSSIHSFPFHNKIFLSYTRMYYVFSHVWLYLDYPSPPNSLLLHELLSVFSGVDCLFHTCLSLAPLAVLKFVILWFPIHSYKWSTRLTVTGNWLNFSPLTNICPCWRFPSESLSILKLRT